METSQNLISTLEESFSAGDRFQTMHKILSNLLAEGYDRESMINDLLAYSVILDQSGREEDSDSIKDLLDCFYGWCSSAWDL